MLSRDFITQIVQDQDLILLGIVPLQPEEHYPSFRQWLHEKKHANMSYLEKYPQLRQDPAQLLAGAKSALILALPYYQGDRFSRDNQFRIAQYARIRDYHKVLLEKGQKILSTLLTHLPPGQVGRVLVDSAPVLERSLAQRTERGFRGKNTCYIHPEFGSFLLLGEIFLSASFAYDNPAQVSAEQRTSKGGCGTCQRCEVYCPTAALNNFQLDANKCLSYYTIEHRGTIPTEYWPWLRYYVYGCDICQLVCPYNRKALRTRQVAILPESLPLFDVATMTQQYYEKTFGGTALTRAKKNGLQRNALIAMYVSGDPRLVEAKELVQKEGDALLLATLEQMDTYHSIGKLRIPTTT